MSIILITAVWLQAGPMVQTTPMDSVQTCRVAAEAVMDIISNLAETNLNAPHKPLRREGGTTSNEWHLYSATVGRQVASARCVGN